MAATIRQRCPNGSVEGGRRKSGRHGLASILCLTVAACGNPYALNLGSINLSAEQKPGVIQFTDPKLFKRAALLNERRNEQSFLENLRKNSEDDKFDFAPEIVREIEVLRAVSAAVGLQFDPAAAANFRRDSEVADLKHEIELTRLQMQLAQLRRDAELLQDLLKKQTELSAPLGQPAAGGGGPVTSNLSGADTQAALTQVNTLIDQLSRRLDAQSRPPATSTGTVGPIDKFNDLSAYRGVLKSAINAVSLDELHDKNGNSLFRLQLKAVVLPDAPNYLDTLGILRMEIDPPRMSDADVGKLYREWLMHVNRSLNRAPEPNGDVKDRRIGTSTQLVTLGDAGGYFNILRLELPKIVGGALQQCGGVRLAEERPDTCWYVRIAVPDLADRRFRPATLLNLAQSPDAMIGLLRGAQRSVAAMRAPASPEGDSPDTVFRFDNKCQLLPGSEGTLERTDGPGPGLAPDQAISLASSVRAWWPYMAAVLGYFSELNLGGDETAHLSRQLRSLHGNLRAANEAASAFLADLGDKYPRCRGHLLSPTDIAVPPKFAKAIAELGTQARISIYEVAPAERVQRVSTAARAADAVALAAAIAGQLPSFGLGLSGNFAYSRTATGKADAVERAPLVVGFAEPGSLGHALLGPPIRDASASSGNAKVEASPEVKAVTSPAFGWLLGPQVSLDPEKQALVLTQRLRPYDLYADLSLPGWWPSFDLLAYTAWAPNWRNVANGATAEFRSNALMRRIHVPMAHNSADMDGLTASLLALDTGDNIALPWIQSIEPSAIEVCGDEVKLQIRGENIWRATMVHLGGLIVEKDIKVLPDMRGIVIPLKGKDIPTVTSNPGVVTVWTQDGPATANLRFEGQRPAGGKCKAEAPPAAAVSKKPAIADVKPAEISVCDTKVVLTVAGTNLGGATAATLGTIRASALTELPPKDGKLLEIAFDNVDGRRSIGGMTSLDLVVRTKEGTGDGKVAVKQSICP